MALLHCNVFWPARIDGASGAAYAPAPSGLEYTMRRLALLFLALFAFTAPALAQDGLRLTAQVPLLPLADSVQPDIDDLAVALWQPYYHTRAEHAFARENLRAGRFDLNADGEAELILMVVAPGWEADQGNPFVIARWVNRRWLAIGWGWGDEDSLFATNDVAAGWRTLVSHSQVIRWSGREYQAHPRSE